MKTKIMTLMLGMAAMLASCSSDDALQVDRNESGLKEVTITATMPESMTTRAVTATDDDQVGRCLLQILIFDHGTQTFVPITTGDLAGIHTMNSNGTNQYTLNGIYLNEHEDYKFLFWADDNSSYNATDLQNVTLTGNNPGIAWHDNVAWSDPGASKGTKIYATLTHAVAKVTLKTTTDVQSNTKVSVNIPNDYAYSAFNVSEGKAITAIQDGKTFSTTTSAEITGTTDGTEVFSFYALVAEATPNITLENSNNHDVYTTVYSVPFGPNKHITLLGDVRNIGLDNVTFNATIQTSWETPATDPTEF